MMLPKKTVNRIFSVVSSRGLDCMILSGEQSVIYRYIESTIGRDQNELTG